MIKSFGCSFFSGSELSDYCEGTDKTVAKTSRLTWPALVAREKNLDYKCYALAGAGNLFILNRILENHNSNDICLINWTWIDRHDFIDPISTRWKTLRPANNTQLEKFYFQNLHSQYTDILTNLGYIKIALDYLLEHKIKFIMTYMDYLLFDQISANWHSKEPIVYLQDKIKPYMTEFAGQNFLDWSKNNGHKISALWHPLEEAHAAAAQYIINQNLV